MQAWRVNERSSDLLRRRQILLAGKEEKRRQREEVQAKLLKKVPGRGSRGGWGTIRHITRGEGHETFNLTQAGARGLPLPVHPWPHENDSMLSSLAEACPRYCCCCCCCCPPPSPQSYLCAFLASSCSGQRDGQ